MVVARSAFTGEDRGTVSRKHKLKTRREMKEMGESFERCLVLLKAILWTHFATIGCGRGMEKKRNESGVVRLVCSPSITKVDAQGGQAREMCAHSISVPAQN